MMVYYDYKVVPAPKKGVKSKGVKTAEDRFAHAIELQMNALAAEGWEYLRAETLPCDARAGLTGHTTAYHNVLVFRRVAPQDKSQNEMAPIVQESHSGHRTAPPATPQSAIDPASDAVGTSTDESPPKTETDADLDADRTRLKSAFDV